MKVKKQKKRSRLDPRDFVLKMGFSLAGGQGWEGEKCLQQNGGRKGLLPTKRKIVRLTFTKDRRKSDRSMDIGE